MTRQTFTTDRAPSSPLFSQGVRLGDAVYVSGMVGIDTGTGRMAGGTIQEQTVQALRNCEAVLEAAGATLDDVGMVTVLLANPDDFAGMNDAYATVFSADPPARAVGRLGPVMDGVLVSVYCVAGVSEG